MKNSSTTKGKKVLKENPSESQKLQSPIPSNLVGTHESKHLKHLRETLGLVASTAKGRYTEQHDYVGDEAAGAEKTLEEYLKKYPKEGLIDEDSVLDLISLIHKSLDAFADTLAKTSKVTQERALCKAVKEFAEELDVRGIYTGTAVYPKYLEAQKLLEEATQKVPTKLLSIGDFTSLARVFGLIVKAFDTLVPGIDLRVPKIPNALDEEDPRQQILFSVP